MDTTQHMEMNQMAARLTGLITQQQNEFLFLATSEVAQKCLQSQSLEACNPAASLMRTMMKVNRSIDHARLINQHGHEIVRINRTQQNTLVLVPPHDLQNKKTKIYFKESLETVKHNIYLSPLDLNMENGEVEMPRKPILRIGKAIHDSKDNILGVAVVNYRARAILRQLNGTILHPQDSWYLVNPKGHYLRSTTPDKEFSFMFPNKVQKGFFTDFPNAWESYLSHPSESFLNEQGKFYFKKIFPSEMAHNRATSEEWILVMHVPVESVQQLSSLLRLGLLIGALLLCPILGILGWKNGRLKAQQKWYLEELARNAVTDNLTGLLNHRGVMEKLSPAVAISNRRNSPLVLVFVDINDLKVLNDHMGHQMGDRLIMGAAKALLHTVRNTDIVGRLGGDEFVVGLVDCDIPHANSVMRRVETMLARLGALETGKSWTMSWGCTEREMNDTAEQMISRADKQMYAHKNIYKTGQHIVPQTIDMRPN